MLHEVSPMYSLTNCLIFISVFHFVIRGEYPLVKSLGKRTLAKDTLFECSRTSDEGKKMLISTFIPQSKFKAYDGKILGSNSQ